ncbi:protein phosphatase CheZ [Pyruvatibacter sp.]|uniref:protein phosphatase CheZ n=1 Tax=Pyruvatibacter sp. TaxID=1981328 RepID=UPI0032ED6A32
MPDTRPMPQQSNAAEAELQKIRGQLEAMNSSIAATRAEIAALRDPHSTGARVDEATGELDAIVEATENATSAILEAAEHMDTVAADVAALDNGSPKAMAQSEKIGELTAEIFTACSFQDITGQRISKVVAVLKELEQRTADLLDSSVIQSTKKNSDPDAHLLNGPAAAGEGVDQEAVDAMFA